MITVYSKPACPACVRAKMLLQNHGLTYKEEIIGIHIMRETFLAMYPNVKSVPLIIADGGDGLYEVVGDSEDLQRWLADKGTEGLLE